jgi:hypothetical protein
MESFSEFKDFQGFRLCLMPLIFSDDQSAALLNPGEYRSDSVLVPAGRRRIVQDEEAYCHEYSPSRFRLSPNEHFNQSRRIEDVKSPKFYLNEKNIR